MGLLGSGLVIYFKGSNDGAPPYVVEDLEPPTEDPYAWINEWKRPEGPVRVGLQAGHWKNSELPEELDRLIGSTGSSGGGKNEWEVNLTIAQETKKILEAEGIVVDILPATIPKNYWADVFIAIHADGNKSWQPSGYKAATPRRDFSGKADTLLAAVESSYEAATHLIKDDNISRNMRGYYAFAWWRYEHAVHPRTAAIILETGFLTNPSDRRILVENPKLSAQGIASGVITYLKEENLLIKDEG